MSRVPPDFSVLGYHHDPVSGDCDEIGAQATYLRTVSQRVRDAHEGLDQALRSDHISKQLDSILANVTAVSGKLQLVQSRYLGAAAALDAYREALIPIQREADALAANAADQHNYDSRQYDRSAGLSRQMTNTTDPTAYNNLKVEFDEVERQRATARANIDDAKEELRQLITARNSQAETAAVRVSTAADGSGLNDTLIDHITNAIDKIVQYVKDHSEIFKKIGDVLGWISLGLTVLSIFCPPLAIFAAILGGISGAFSLVGGLGKVLKDGDWGSFALTAASSVLSIFGAGKAIKAVGKIMTAGKLTLPKAIAAYGKAQGRLVNQLGHGTARMKAFFRQTVGHKTPLLKRAVAAVRTVTEFLGTRRVGHIISDGKLLTRVGMSQHGAEQTARVIDLTARKVVPIVGKSIVTSVIPSSPAHRTERTYMQVAA